MLLERAAAKVKKNVGAGEHDNLKRMNAALTNTPEPTPQSDVSATVQKIKIDKDPAATRPMALRRSTRLMRQNRQNTLQKAEEAWFNTRRRKYQVLRRRAQELAEPLRTITLRTNEALSSLSSRFRSWKRRRRLLDRTLERSPIQGKGSFLRFPLLYIPRIFSRSEISGPRQYRLSTETLYRLRPHEYFERRNKVLATRGRVLTKSAGNRLWAQMQTTQGLDGLGVAPASSDDRRSGGMSTWQQEDLVESVGAFMRSGGNGRASAEDEIAGEENSTSNDEKTGDGEDRYKPYNG